MLAQHQRTAIAQQGEAAELVAGIGLGERLGAFGQGVAGEQRGERRVVHTGEIETEVARQDVVQQHQLRCRRGGSPLL